MDTSKEKKSKRVTKTKAVAIRKNTMPVNIDSSTVSINPEAMIMAAIHSGAAMDTIERLLSMRERIQKEKAEIAFWQAMAQFQAKCPIIVKSNKVNFSTAKGSVNYQYAPLDVIVKAVRPILMENGLSYSFTSTQTDKAYTAICNVHHILGHTQSSTFTIDIDPDSKMNDAQRTGTARSYANRYAFCNGFGILTGEQDTDGHGLNDSVKPETDKAKKEEENRIKAEEAEDIERLRAFSENTREGFKLLGYTAKAAIKFSIGHKWNEAKILDHLNLLANEVTK